MTRGLGRIARLGVAAMLVSTAASADPVTDRVVAQLHDQGFGRITISRTWLGRVLIIGSDAGGQREVVLNPNTGEILRDYFRPSVVVANDGNDDDNIGSTPLGGGPDDDPDIGDEPPDRPNREPQGEGGTGGGGGTGGNGVDTDTEIAGGGESGGGEIGVGDEAAPTPQDPTGE